MKKLLTICAAVVLSAGIGAGVAVAATSGGPTERTPNPPTTGATEGVNLAEAPTTRVAVWVNGGAEEGQYAVVRGKGISAVTNPDPGLWCVRPNVSGLHPSKVVPMTSVEYSGSTTFNDAIQWRSIRTLCPAGTLEFLSFQLGSGVPNNDVSFTVMIP